MTSILRSSLRPTVGIATLVLLAGASGAAIAQTSAPGAGQSAPSTVQGGTGESLSSKLSRSGGVIAPKSDVDPGIRAQAPDPQPGSTPVIPPSATGGGAAK